MPKGQWQGDGPPQEGASSKCKIKKRRSRCDIKKQRSIQVGSGSPDNEPSIAELLDASMDKRWLADDLQEERVADGTARLFEKEDVPKKREASFKSRDCPFKPQLPLPTRDELDEMERETMRLPREAPPGPVASAWLERVKQWVWTLRLFFRGTQRKVCGVWRDLYAHWVQLLKVLPKKRRDRVLKMIREGIDLPWATDMPDNLRDPATGGCPKNVNLKAASERVWDTLYEQLVEKAVLPWNCFNRDDVDVLPLGMFPIFWTTKAGTSKIRIIIDL